MAVQISRILHAGYVFSSNGIDIAFDPIFENPFSGNCYAFPALQFDSQKIQNLNFKAVFISHYHDDHCSLKSLDLIQRDTAIYIYCLHEEIFSWIKELGFTKVFPLVLNQAVHIGNFEIIPRRALDEDVDSIFEIHVEGLKILNVVDSWIDPEILLRLAKQNPWDLVLWPFQTMREVEVIAPRQSIPSSQEMPEEWIPQIKDLNPKFLVPSSCQFQFEEWSWLNQVYFPISYRSFQRQMKSILPSCQIQRMNPGCRFELTKKSFEKVGILDWIHPVGPQDLDYEYQADFIPTSVSEITMRFPKAIPAEMSQIELYCEAQVLEIYKSLEVIDEAYFQFERLWNLCIYNHEEIKNYYYRVSRSQIEILKQIPPLQMEAIGWKTEIAATKLHAALFHGESLSSLYIRVNDHAFSSSMQQGLQTVDPLMDPLIRCLFNGDFGAYQKNQLQHLLHSGAAEDRFQD